MTDTWTIWGIERRLSWRENWTGPLPTSSVYGIPNQLSIPSGIPGRSIAVFRTRAAARNACRRMRFSHFMYRPVKLRVTVEPVA